MNRLMSLNRSSAAVVGMRKMSSHSGPAPTGWEKTVRDKLPHDYQVVLATLGFYSSLLLVGKLWPSSKKPAEETATSSSSSADMSTEIPSILDDKFDEWAKIAGNLAKWEKSLDTLE